MIPDPSKTPSQTLPDPEKMGMGEGVSFGAICVYAECISREQNVLVTQIGTKFTSTWAN